MLLPPLFLTWSGGIPVAIASRFWIKWLCGDDRVLEGLVFSPSISVCFQNKRTEVGQFLKLSHIQTIASHTESHTECDYFAAPSTSAHFGFPSKKYVENMETNRIMHSKPSYTPTDVCMSNWGHCYPLSSQGCRRDEETVYAPHSEVGGGWSAYHQKGHKPRKLHTHSCFLGASPRPNPPPRRLPPP